MWYSRAASIIALDSISVHVTKPQTKISIRVALIGSKTIQTSSLLLVLFNIITVLIAEAKFGESCEVFCEQRGARENKARIKYQHVRVMRYHAEALSYAASSFACLCRSKSKMQVLQIPSFADAMTSSISIHVSTYSFKRIPWMSRASGVVFEAKLLFAQLMVAMPFEFSPSDDVLKWYCNSTKRNAFGFVSV